MAALIEELLRYGMSLLADRLRTAEASGTLTLLRDEVISIMRAQLQRLSDSRQPVPGRGARLGAAADSRNPGNLAGRS